MGVSGLHWYCRIRKHLILNVDPSCYTNEPSALISNMLLHIFLVCFYAIGQSVYNWQTFA